jgi:hypothetical protein
VIVLESLLHVAERALGATPQVRDHGLLESALARPRASALGRDAYPTIHEKAAALLHSIARNHALVDGNKRLALAATLAFYGSTTCASRCQTTTPTTSSSRSPPARSTTPPRSRPCCGRAPLDERSSAAFSRRL